MIHRGWTLLLIGQVVFMSIGCSGGGAVKMGSVPVTAIAPSNPINYPVGPAGKGPGAKNVIPGKVPNKK